MKTNPFILFSILFLFALNAFANEIDIELEDNVKSGEIFTSKDKDYLQLWHYGEVLKIDLSEECLN